MGTLYYKISSSNTINLPAKYLPCNGQLLVIYLPFDEFTGKNVIMQLIYWHYISTCDEFTGDKFTK